jgi:hypothetical protein
MESAPFHGAKLKVKRADKHIRELLSVLNSFGKKGGYRTWSQDDPKTGEGMIGFTMTEKVSDDLSVMVGDVVHNLRASLDLMIYAMMKLFGQTPNDYTRFPFRKTRKEVKAAIKGGTIKGFPAAIKTLIVTVKPYKGRNNPLYTLHTLDIVDKHHNLVATRVFAGLTVKTVGEAGTRYYVNFSPEASTEESIIRVPQDEQIEGYHQPMLHVSFDRVQGLKTKSVLPTLLRLSRYVTEVINVFERACLTLKK